MKNNYDLNHVSNKELNASVELTESEMNDLAGGFGLETCTSGDIAPSTLFCMSDNCRR